jgi:methylphosphotriester-DNA--protein-cysteine methyltransferase
LSRTWTLIGADGRPFESDVPGELGGHRRTKIYGRLDCRGARQAIERGGYVANRVFFRDEAAAIAAGFRPCAVCMPEGYRAWKLGSGHVQKHQNPLQLRAPSG